MKLGTYFCQKEKGRRVPKYIYNNQKKKKTVAHQAKIALPTIVVLFSKNSYRQTNPCNPKKLAKRQQNLI